MIGQRFAGEQSRTARLPACVVLAPRWFRRFSAALNRPSLPEIEGLAQNVDDVIHVRVRELPPPDVKQDLPRGHDYH